MTLEPTLLQVIFAIGLVLVLWKVMILVLS